VKQLSNHKQAMPIAASDAYLHEPIQRHYQRHLDKHTERDMRRSNSLSSQKTPSAHARLHHWRRSLWRHLSAQGTGTSIRRTNPSFDRHRKGHSFPNPSMQPTFCLEPHKHTARSMHSNTFQLAQTFWLRTTSPLHLGKSMLAQSGSVDIQTFPCHTTPNFDCHPSHCDHTHYDPKKRPAACHRSMSRWLFLGRVWSFQ